MDAAVTRAEPFVIHDTTVMPGTTATVAIPVSRQATGYEASLALKIAHGAASGPCIFASGAIHGDEITGTAIVQKLAQTLDPTRLSGTVKGAWFRRS